MTPSYCVHCRWYSGAFELFAVCAAPNNRRHDLVTGDLLKYGDLHTLRASMEPLDCGPDGKWWQPLETKTGDANG